MTASQSVDQAQPLPDRPELLLVPKTGVPEGPKGNVPHEDADAPAAPSRAGRGGRFRRLAGAVGKRLATLAVALIAIVSALLTWQYYVMSPWTRNGSVRVQVANVAPQISGQIVDLKVSDNQFVHKGDVLYVIDPFDFQVAVQTAKANLDQRAADLQVKQAQSQRRQNLSSIATTPEEQQIYAGNAEQAKAAFEAAQQALAQAQLNLQRTRVLSPVNGYVTNFLLRPGDYAPAGNPNISVIDADSFWIDGYFEETKMANICVGDRVEAMLMGFAQPIEGHVETITRGISVANATPSTQGLPNVDPIYTWVRLAQRVPVRIAIDHVPAGLPLVSGLTATVSIAQPTPADDRNWLVRSVSKSAALLSELYYGPQARPGCVPAMTGPSSGKQTIPASEVPLSPPADKLVPGIVPGINVPPRAS